MVIDWFTDRKYAKRYLVRILFLSGYRQGYKVDLGVYWNGLGELIHQV